MRKPASKRITKTPSINFFNYLFLVLILILKLFIKIGQISQIAGSWLWRNLQWTIYNLQTSIRRRPGRPRKLPWLKFQVRKIKKFFFFLIPKSARFKILILSGLVMFFLYSLAIAKLTAVLPSPRELTNHRPLTTQFFDRHGRLLYQLYEGQNRQPISLDKVSPYLIEATIAIEDKHFFTHPGVDFLGIIRASWINLTQGKIEGGSTLTQQLIKNTLLSPDRTMVRKIKEILLSFWAERIYSKEEILTMYFNEAPYGGPAWGVEAAAKMYFGKKARDLNLAESAFLAGLPAAPSEYSPYSAHPEKGKERQKEVLRRMVEDSYISKIQADAAITSKLPFQPPIQEIKAPHFVMYVRSILAESFGEKTVSQGGLKVTTSLDLGIQEMAETIVANEVAKLNNLKVSNGAAEIVDAKTGQILAMVGSKDYFDLDGGSFNVALALRQPGSAIKPITYTAAFKQGFSPGTTILDAPTTFSNPWGKSYSPVNYDNRFHGPVSIRLALGSSYNVPAVKTLALIGLPEMIQTAKEMGLSTLNRPEDYGLSLTLGGGGIRLLEMMTVYTTLANLGIKFEPTPILTVTDSFGNILEDHRQETGKRVLAEEVTYLTTDILADNEARVPAFGRHSLLEIPGRTVAVKTGTSDDKRDNWTFGFTPEYVVGVWVGNNDNSPMDRELTSGITGAAPIWHQIMANLLADRPDLSFKRPAGIIEATIDGHKDLAISGQTPRTIVGLKKTKQRDKAGNETETITYSDPFSTFTPESSKTNQ